MINKTYLFIYKTTNMINGKYYIGQHKTNNIEDNYLGSGYALIRAIKKYGKHNFKREIIAFANSQEELNELENSILNNHYQDDDCYNLIAGGNCTGYSEETRRKMSESAKNRIVSKETREIHSKQSKKMWENPEHRRKMSQKMKQHYQNVEERKKTGERSKEFYKNHPDIQQKCIDAMHKASRKYWSDENNRKKFGESIKGEKHPQYGSKCKRARKVYCITTNEYFDCIADAARKYHVCDSAIVDNCKQKVKQVKGYVFEYVQ